MDWFGSMWNDLPTRVAVVGSLVYAAMMPALVWWTSRHYVSSEATQWRLTSWEKTVDAEGGAVSRQPARQSNGEAADDQAWQEVT